MIKLNEDGLNYLLSREREVGRVQCAVESKASIQALVGENSKLKAELDQILKLGQDGVTRRVHEAALKEIVHLLLKGGAL